MEIDAAVVELYGLAPEEFVAARNQLAKAVPDRGDEAAAAAIGALRKPTIAAWLANQLVRADPDGLSCVDRAGGAVAGVLPDVGRAPAGANSPGSATTSSATSSTSRVSEPPAAGVLLPRPRSG